jgi:hypothetical protein
MVASVVPDGEALRDRADAARGRAVLQASGGATDAETKTLAHRLPLVQTKEHAGGEGVARADGPDDEFVIQPGAPSVNEFPRRRPGASASGHVEDDPGDALGLEFVTDEQVDLGQGGFDGGIVGALRAHEIDGAMESSPTGFVEHATDDGSVIGVGGIHAVEQQNVAEVEVSDVDGVPVELLRPEKRVGAALVKERPADRRLD